MDSGEGSDPEGRFADGAEGNGNAIAGSDASGLIGQERDVAGKEFGRSLAEADEAGRGGTRQVGRPELTVDHPMAVMTDKPLEWGIPCMKDEFGTRTREVPLFGSTIERGQVRPVHAGSCWISGVMDGLAGERPETIDDLISENDDGYLVSLHKVEEDERGVYVPTGERVDVPVGRELPVLPGTKQDAYMRSDIDGILWPSVVLAALADKGDLRREGPGDDSLTGYTRINAGGNAAETAKVVAQLSGIAAGVAQVEVDNEGEAANTFQELIENKRLAFIGTKPSHDGAPLASGLESSHLHEILSVESGYATVYSCGDLDLVDKPVLLPMRQLLADIEPVVVTLDIKTDTATQK